MTSNKKKKAVYHGNTNNLFNVSANKKDYRVDVGSWPTILFWFLLVTIIYITFKFFPSFTSISSFGNIYIKLFISFFIVTFIVFGIDKLLSSKAKNRFSNSVLYFLAATSGGIASFLARHRFRHKTLDHGKDEKNYATRFKIIEMISFIVNLIIFIIII